MKLLFKVFVGVLILALVGLAGVGFMAFQFLYGAPSDSTEAVVFDIRPGESFKSTARRLEREGLVSSARGLEIYARLAGHSANLRVGEYSIRRDVTPRELVEILTSGISIQYSITFQEGLNQFEIAELVERQKIATKKEFLQLTKDKAFIQDLLGEDVSSLEGYLFPETYHFTKFTTAKSLIRMMVERFKTNYQFLLGESGWNKKGMNRHELVTLASIIEKETGAPEERPVISSVFHNRLNMNMRLQTDPTVIYGIWEQSGYWNRNISKGDLLRPTRYNTYTFAGLPYGPISNPGFDALKAAGDPANTEFLFFVSRNDGTHIFSKTYAQHRTAVAQYQKDRRARQGKSWRDLNRRKKTPAAVQEAEPTRADSSKKL